MNKTMDNFMTIPEISGVFVDAILTDESDHLIFGSFWGHDTAIRDFQGRLTLGQAESGMTSFHVIDDHRNQLQETFTRISNNDSLKQMTGRVHTDILGDLVHCWLYSKEVVTPDLANHRMMLLNQDETPSSLWSAIKMVCPIPLLDQWEYQIKQSLIDANMITFLDGINQTGIKIVIDEEKMAAIVKNGCIDGSLTIQ